MDSHNVHEAVSHVWKLVDFANKNIDLEKPWSLIKTDPDKARSVLCNLLEVIRHISLMVEPFIPQSSGKLRLMLGLPPVASFADEREWGSVTQWHNVGKGVILFPLIEPPKLEAK